MLCTKCSEQVRPVVAVDIDGTLGDFHTHFAHFAQEYTGEPMTTGWWRLYKGDVPYKEWMKKALLLDDRSWYDLKLAYRQGGLKRSMPIIDGASSLTKYIRWQGAELWLTTTRPYNRLDNIDPDTREWVRRRGIEFDYMIYDDDKYQLLAERVDPRRVVAVLDDLPEQYDAAETAFGPEVPIMIRNFFNSGVDRPCVATGLTIDAKREIGRRLQTWYREYRDSGMSFRPGTVTRELD